MENKFKHYSPLSEEEIKNIWSSAIFVFDTNVLLHIYRYPEDIREKFFSILEDDKIKNRIFTPHQIAEEFHKNRANVICDQLSIYEKIKSIPKKHLDNLIEEISKTFSHKHHPFISKDELLSKIEKFKSDFIDCIDKDKKQYPLLVTEDKYLLRMQKIIFSTIGIEYPSDELKKIFDEGKERYKRKFPPGYEDMEKGEPDMFSDLIIWKQTIAKSKESQKDVIFISDDRKNDWILQIKGKKIGLRPELRKEFYEQTKRTVLCYDSANLFKYIKSFLSTEMTITTDTMQTITNFSNSISWHPTKTTKKSISTEIPSWYKPQTIQQEKSKLSAENLIEWWYQNYEDPANGVPYESSEGGYQYIFGGPYDPEEEFNSYFVNVNKDEVKKAVDKILNDGIEWVKKGEY